MGQQILPNKSQTFRGMVEIDSHGKITWVNAAVTQLTGLAAAQVIGQSLGFIYRNPQNAPLFDLMWQTVFNGNAWRDKLVYLAADGTHLLHELEITPITTESGEIDHFFAVIQNAKELDTDSLLQSNEYRYRQIVEQSPILIATFRGEDLVYINPAGARCLGFATTDEMLGKPWHDFFPPDMIPQWSSEVDRSEPYEFQPLSLKVTVNRQDGRPIDLSITLLLPSTGMDTIQVIGQDITENKRAQESLRKQILLSKIDLAISHSVELDKVLDLINEYAVRALSVKVGAAILLEDAAKKMMMVRSSNVRMDSLDTTLDHEPEHTMAVGWIAKHKRPLVITDTVGSPYENSEFLKNQGVRSGLGMPLLVDDDLIGILFILDDHPRQYDSLDIEFITALANRAALAVAKVEFYRSLQSAKASAEVAAQDRADYLASMSHELRTPLAAINNLSDLMSSTILSQQQAEYLALIKSSTARLLALMNDVLDYSRLEASKLGLVEKQFNLIQLVENALDLAAIPAAQKGLDLAYRIDEDVPETLVGDSNRLSQVLTNLLTNAIKFTTSGHIYVEIRQRAEKIAMISMVDSKVELQFSVQDTGIGISAEKQANLFKPFSQIHGTHKLAEPGSGLGLAICKKLVQLMNGDIWVTSPGMAGKGSTFTFTIRARVVHTPTAPFLQPEQSHLQGKRVVLVGQPVISWALLASRLEFWGMSVDGFDDAEAAADWLASGPQVDFIILDVKTIHPTKEGRLEKAILHLRQEHDLPVIAYANPNTRLQENLRQLTTKILRRPISIPRLYRSLVDSIQFAGAVTRPRTLEADLEILLVDDDLINLAAVQLQLERLGFTADTVSTGIEALQAMANKKFDLVIMDMRMDAMDGYATTRAIRQELPSDQQPVIAILTAGVTANQLNALQSAGIDAYLEKPTTIDRLLHLVELVRLHEVSGPNNGQFEIVPLHPQTASVIDSGMDMKVLNDLVNLAGTSDNQRQSKIFDLFFESAPLLVQQASEAAHSGHLEILKEQLHALRGTCDVFGAVRLSQLIQDLEHNLPVEATPDLTQRMDDIETEFKAVAAILSDYRSEPTA